MRDSIKCFACGWGWQSPWPRTAATISWSNDCACSDRGDCVAHKFNFDDAPVRPSENVLVARAEELSARDRADWQTKKNELERLEREVEILREIADAVGFLVRSGYDGPFMDKPVEELFRAYFKLEAFR